MEIKLQDGVEVHPEDKHEQAWMEVVDFGRKPAGMSVPEVVLGANEAGSVQFSY
jgi:hypothetical protein